MVKVSVLMPVYNLEDYIEHAMESIFNQTLKDIEIVCVNDGSVDNSYNILKKFASKYDFIKVFSQENKGAGPALNKCIEEATGEYIAFLDADDIYVDEDALEKMYKYAVKNDADMVAGNLKFVEDDYRIVDSHHYKRELYKFCDKETSFSPSQYGIPFAFYKNIFKREFLNENNIRFPPYKRGVDTLFLARALVNVDRIYGIPVWLYGYNHQVGGGFNKKLSDYDFITNFFKVFKGVFDVFYEAGFDNLAYEYKKELFLYLRYKDNAIDWNIYEIVMDIFGEDGHYFEDYLDDYNVFLASQWIHHVYECPTEKLLNETREKVLKLNLLENKKISKDLMRKSFILQTVDNIDEFTRRYLETDYLDLRMKYEKLVDKNLKLKKKNRKLKNKNSDLKKDLKQQKKLTKMYANSLSWKITSPIRVLKRKLRGR